MRSGAVRWRPRGGSRRPVGAEAPETEGENLRVALSSRFRRTVPPIDPVTGFRAHPTLRPA